MKRTLLLVCLTSFTLAAQTKVNLEQVRPPVVPTQRVAMIVDGAFALVELDSATLVLDKTVTPYKLKALPAAAKLPEVEQFTASSEQAVWSLQAAPSSPTVKTLSVYRNGVLQREGAAPSDYTVSSQTVTFNPKSVPQPDDFVEFRYF